MFASLASLLAAPLIGGLFLRRSNKSSPEEDLEALVARIRQRLYPETIPALVSFWLKTVCARGYSLRRWKELNRLLKLALAEPLDDPTREVISEIKNWIQETVVLRGQTPEFTGTPPCDPTLSHDHLAADLPIREASAARAASFKSPSHQLRALKWHQPRPEV